VKFVVQTVLEAPVERIWAEVKTPRLLNHVAAPLIVFDLIDPPTMPAYWGDGRYLVRMRFLGLIPLGQQWIVTSTLQPEDQARGVFRIRDNGTGDIAKVWDHLIVIEAQADGRTAYRDEVEVRAGLLTLGVWLFAHWFYRHRQARWRRLVRQGFRYPGDSA
jgi:ligand-binding SRPBCC domain-containing protein